MYLGGDPFNESLNGRIRDFELLYGPRSYLTGNLDHLIEANPPKEVRDAMAAAFGAKLANVLVESEANSEKPVYKLEIPPNLLDDVYSVSYSFWFRFSTQTPQKLTDLEFLKE